MSFILVCVGTTAACLRHPLLSNLVGGCSEAIARAGNSTVSRFASRLCALSMRGPDPRRATILPVQLGRREPERIGAGRCHSANGVPTRRNAYPRPSRRRPRGNRRSGPILTTHDSHSWAAAVTAPGFGHDPKHWIRSPRCGISENPRISGQVTVRGVMRDHRAPSRELRLAETRHATRDTRPEPVVACPPYRESRFPPRRASATASPHPGQRL